MAKANVWQWDETAANNTEINGISLAENTMLPSAVNNAFREALSQIITMEGKGSDVASATTLTLGSERYYHVTGTTTITDIDFTDAVDGRWAWLVFDGALTLTHNSTTLKLPGAASIVTEAGDRALFVQDSSDNVICLVYVRAAGVPSTTGTFTPALTFGGGSTGLTYAGRTGNYTRIGNRVFFDITVSLSAKGSSTGVASISGLPFTPGAGAIVVGRGSALSSLTAGVLGQISSGTAAVDVRRATTTGDAACSDTNFTDTSAVAFSGVYLV